MTRPATRFVVSSRVGEKTGAPIWVVTDCLTSRTRLVTNDLSEASALCDALNNNQPLLAEAILSEFTEFEPVEYGGSI